ncbi:MAG: ribonuclease E activity regulator RraA [Gammaproteobacteria bacterium]|nr:ribonuclease E activity regulator RraA [Gammaproteobacteria bacterium]
MRPTTDLYDDHEETVQTCSVQFRDFGTTRAFAGRIRTVRCREDNQLFRSLLDEPGKGDVVVVDGGGSTAAALMGDILGAKALNNGWSGCVIYGAVRDSVELATIAVGIKALGVNPAKSAKTGAGEVDVPVQFGGVTFEPGHWVYCDADGILVSPTRIE